jgi:hypothetical protein
MDVRDVVGLANLKYAVVTPQNVVVSLHQHPDAANRFISTYGPTSELEMVELRSDIGYKKS